MKNKFKTLPLRNKVINEADLRKTLQHVMAGAAIYNQASEPDTLLITDPRKILLIKHAN